MNIDKTMKAMHLSTKDPYSSEKVPWTFSFCARDLDQSAPNAEGVKVYTRRFPNRGSLGSLFVRVHVEGQGSIYINTTEDEKGDIQKISSWISETADCMGDSNADGNGCELDQWYGTLKAIAPHYLQGKEL